ncbi:AMP-binding protein [Kangiella marina]|uniref:ApeI dehydratase-like domain-containing protein n=1 Tax=Kangiella marina TaxID=1079178 RepID=A0ABP8IJQ3_9GAMM
MKYPQILNSQVSPYEATLKLQISAQLDAFAGHFDQFPIVPGVVQTQWALDYFKQLIAPELNTQPTWSVDKVSALKFQHVITPETDVNLNLSYDPAKHCLTFKFDNAEHNFSSGKLFFRDDKS